MKKLISAVAAGALLLSAVGVVFASTELTNKDNTVVINASSVSRTGNNDLHGRGSLTMTTGDAYSLTSVLSVANQNATGSIHGHGSVELLNKYTTVTIDATSVSKTGNNELSGSHHSSHHSSQTLTTGLADSATGVQSWANVNLLNVSLSP